MSNIEDYFLKNLSYCMAIKRRKQGYAIYQKDFSEDHECVQYITDEVLSSRGDKTRLIYYFFLDKRTLVGFKALFNDISYSVFKDYFHGCLKRVKKGGTFESNKLEFINLFHLIGSLRLLKNRKQYRDEIYNNLYEILDSPANVYPLVIKYSAYQIMVEMFFDDKTSVEPQKFSKFIETLRKEIPKNNSLAKFIALYSFFYYDFGKTEIEIMNKHIDKIDILNDSFLKNLHQYLPQIQSLFIRNSKCLPPKLHKKFKELYYVSDTSMFDVTSEFLSNIRMN